MVSATNRPRVSRNSTMTLRSLLDRYMSSVEVSPRYAESLRRTVRKLEGSGLEKICQLSADKLNDFLAALSLSATTRHNIRRESLTLWRYAFDCGLTDEYPARVRKIRPTYAPPQAWTLQQLDEMLTAAEADETPLGGKSGLRRCDVLPAWIGMAYDSGLRFADVHSVSGCSIRNNCVAVVEQKTGKAAVRRLTPETIKSVGGLLKRSPNGTLFKWALTRRRAFLVWRAFLDQHGFAGSSKWFRRAAATQVELKERGGATAFLQHSHPALAQRHYNDASQLAPPPSPTPIRK